MTVVLVDALACKPGQSGILSHGLSLVRGLAACAEAVEVVVLTSAIGEFAEIGGCRILPAPPLVRSFGSRALWREASLSREIDRARADVLISTVPELPMRRTKVPAIMVVHDVAAVVAPALYSWRVRARYELLLRGALSRADRIVCDTHATLLDLHRWAGTDPRRCTVIGNVPQVLPPGTGRRLVEPDYLLLVGNVFDNKNTSTVLRAMKILKGEMASAGLDPLRLVMVGPLGPAAGLRLKRESDALGVGDLLEHRGFVTKGDLADLYGSALAVLYPSLYEGQGLPVMEAAALGTPVIASDLPCIREFVTAEMVRFVDRPLEPEAWADAVSSVRTGWRPTRSNPSLSWRVEDVGQAFAALSLELSAGRRDDPKAPVTR